MEYLESMKMMTNKDLLNQLIRESENEDVVTNLLDEKDVPGIFFDCTYEELTELYSINKEDAGVIIAVQELYRRLNSEYRLKRAKISSPEDVYNLIAPELKFKAKEYFKVLLLSTKNEVIAIETMSIGSIKASIVHPREVYNLAVRKMANAIIICHNHPSFDHPEPSVEDIKITERLVEVGNIIGICCLDHIVISGNEYYSFKENELM